MGLNYGETDFARYLLQIFYGREPVDENEVLRVQSIGQQAANPREALLRYFILSPEFQNTNRGLYAFFFDQMLRRRVFANFRVPKVNLFCVGTSRAGTTTIARCLEKHSKVCLSPVKETNYFTEFSSDTTENGLGHKAYEFYFPNWNKEQIIGDFTPNYLSSAKARDAIFNYNNLAKIIVILRDPVERAISDYYYLKEFHKNTDIHEYFVDGIRRFNMEDATSADWFSSLRVLRRGIYFDDVRGYVEIYNKNLKVLDFCDLQSIRTMLEGLCEFLDIDLEEQVVPPKGKEVENASKKMDSGEESVRSALREFYASDARLVRNHFGIKLCDWL